MLHRNEGRCLAQNDHGFSLLEVLASLAVVMLTLSGSIAVYMNLSSATRYSRDMGEGIAIAQSQLESFLVQLKKGTAPNCRNNSYYPTTGCPSIFRATECNLIKSTGNQSYTVFVDYKTGITSDVTVVKVYSCWSGSGRNGKVEISSSLRQE